MFIWGADHQIYYGRSQGDKICTHINGVDGGHSCVVILLAL